MLSCSLLERKRYFSFLETRLSRLYLISHYLQNVTLLSESVEEKNMNSFNNKESHCTCTFVKQIPAQMYANLSLLKIDCLQKWMNWCTRLIVGSNKRAVHWCCGLYNKTITKVAKMEQVQTKWILCKRET